MTKIVDFIKGEEWREIPGFERTYRVSSTGRVASLPRKTTRGGLLKTPVNKGGYLYCILSQDGRTSTFDVHRLVALAFLGPRPEGMEVRHLDGNSRNSLVTNLAYGTHSANIRDKRAHGTDRNANKTHCPQGHEYSADNTRARKSRPGGRYCKKCEVRKSAAWRRQKAVETGSTATRARERWTEEESRIALDPNLSAEDAARRTGRTLEAILTRRVRLRRDRMA